MGEKLPKFLYFKLGVWNGIKISNPLHVPGLVVPPCLMNWHPGPEGIEQYCASPEGFSREISKYHCTG